MQPAKIAMFWASLQNAVDSFFKEPLTWYGWWSCLWNISVELIKASWLTLSLRYLFGVCLFKFYTKIRKNANWTILRNHAPAIYRQGTEMFMSNPTCRPILIFLGQRECLTKRRTFSKVRVHPFLITLVWMHPLFYNLGRFPQEYVCYSPTSQKQYYLTAEIINALCAQYLLKK